VGGRLTPSLAGTPTRPSPRVPPSPISTPSPLVRGRSNPSPPAPSMHQPLPLQLREARLDPVPHRLRRGPRDELVEPLVESHPRLESEPRLRLRRIAHAVPDVADAVAPDHRRPEVHAQPLGDPMGERLDRDRPPGADVESA